jgi:hypothetical protein
MKGLIALLLLAGVASQARSVFAADNKAPVVFGVTQGNTGCVILEKGMPIKKGPLFAGVIYARTQYRVLESFNYRMEKDKFTGSGEIKELGQIALRDKVKLVAIPAKHSEEQLEEARNICKQ